MCCQGSSLVTWNRTILGSSIALVLHRPCCAKASGKAKVPPSLNNGQIQIQKKLGAGCFGEVYRGFHTGTKEDVAIKFEALQNQSLQLRHEGEMLNLLRLPTQPQGFAKFFFFGQEGNFNCLAMEFLGKSLEDHVQLCGGKFSSKTSCLVAQQVLMRIEYLHSRGVVHRDIKPENFMFGVGNKVHHLYLIDFGLSKRYWDKKHVPSTQKLSLTGTARYASLNAHRGFEQSRRDDLEAIGHMLLYFLRSSLPWSGLEARTKKEKYQKIKEKKESTELSDLCQGQREAFQAYLEYARNLGFKDRPDYMMLRKQFANLRALLEREEGNPIQDWDFEWLQGKELGELEPLLPYDTLEQPDDEQAPSERPRGLCCFRCGGFQVRN
ncbi:CKL10 [Symbiodinium sp. CCMP2592]|nr:CKL10 [Symbiodinium sp. CCMP2592]